MGEGVAVELAGASVAVTGGGSGLRTARLRTARLRTARLLAGRAAHVVVLDVDERAAKTVAEEIGGQAARADLTDADQVTVAVEPAASPAPPRGVVSCAGGGSGRRTNGRDGVVASGQPLDDFARTLSLDTRSTFDVVGIAATVMSGNDPDAGGRRGAVVHTAGAAAFDGRAGQAADSAARAGIVGMTLPPARDPAAVGIRVNTIAPGVFATPPMPAVPGALRDGPTATVPVPKRLGGPAGLAELAVHLPTNDHLNGETIRLDGAARMPAR